MRAVLAGVAGITTIPVATKNIVPTRTQPTQRKNKLGICHLICQRYHGLAGISTCCDLLPQINAVSIPTSVLPVHEQRGAPVTQLSKGLLAVLPDMPAHLSAATYGATSASR